MKAQVQKLAFDNGCAARYSGGERVMYIEGKNAVYVASSIKKQLKPDFEVKVSPNSWVKVLQVRNEIAASIARAGDKKKDKTSTPAVKG